MEVRHQNAYPSLERDYLSIAQSADFLMPVGWYYKTFQSRRQWQLAEPHIRKIAGIGIPPTNAEGDYEHAHWKADVAVIGGGLSGLNAALQHAHAAKDVVGVDDQPELGGHDRYSGGAIGTLIQQATRHSAIRVLSASACFRHYEGNLAGVI